MPVTDLLTRVTDSTTGRPVISALAAPKAIGAPTVSLNDVTNWTTTTAIHFVIYETTASGIKDPTTQTDWKGTLSGTTVSNLTLTGGTDRAYSSGAKVELTPTARFAKDLYDNVIAHANQDGTLKTSAVQAALNIAATSTDWTPLANTPTLASSAGQREHVLQFTGVNYTDRLQAGTKLQIPRTGTTPTTSMNFVSASSQYASKTSPTGITFTDDFTCEAWVYVDSYTGGFVVSRTPADQSNGWNFIITSTGQVQVTGRNGAGNARYTASYQSVPLGKWTHIAATLDMSGWTTTTNKIFIDGVDVPVSLNQAGTNPTLLAQSGDLVLGGMTGGTSTFNGKIANARVWSTIRTAAEIRDNMNKETPASTTGLVAHFKGNGSWNDSSSNANHLTAVGGAVNNFAAHPYSATEYAVVTAVSYASSNTSVTVFTGSNCLPNETLGTASYSTARAPYGFPADKSKWRVMTFVNSDITVTAPTSATLYDMQTNLLLPQGRWLIVADMLSRMNPSAAAQIEGRLIVSATTPPVTANRHPRMSNWMANPVSVGYDIRRSAFSDSIDGGVTLKTYLYVANFTGNVGLVGSSGGPSILEAECAYL